MKRDIEILSVTYLRGPNMWSYLPALEALIDIGALEDSPSDTIPGFPERLENWLPTLIEHRCSYDERGGFLRRLKEGTWPGHIMEHVTLELQSLAGLPGGFGRARGVDIRGQYKVIVTLWHEKVTLRAMQLARELVLACIDDKPFDIKAAVAELRDIADSYCLGPGTAAIVKAAELRGIPAIRLNEGNLVQLGYGKSQRRIWTAETDRTSAIAEGISRDKQLTKQLLSACGVEVPEGRMVSDARDAWAAAEDIGLPVVVKPYDGNHGRGVCINLTEREQVESAFAVASAEGSGVIVERFVSGNEHRLLIVGGKLAAAARGQPAYVTGDGQQTIRELVDTQLNSDPLRDTEGWSNAPLNPVRLDSANRLDLSRQGFEPDSVPPEGTQVLVQRNGNVCFDCTARVHPDTIRQAALAARTVGLDIAGVDLVADDISKPLAEQRGAIVEVNAGPGLSTHLTHPGVPPTPVAQTIIEHLFGERDDGRIPVVGIAGTGGTTLAARIVSHLLQLAGKKVGLACRDGLYLGPRRIDKRDSANFKAGQRLLINRSIEAAVIENGLTVLLDEGLAYDWCQVGVITRMNPEGLVPERHINDLEQLCKVFRTQVDIVLEKKGIAVLNADDESVADMASLSKGEVIFFSRNPQSGVLAGHAAAGGRAVLLLDGSIRLMTGSNEYAQIVAGTIELPIQDDRIASDDGLLAAVAAAWACGLDARLIQDGLETLEPATPVTARAV